MSWIRKERKDNWWKGLDRGRHGIGTGTGGRWIEYCPIRHTLGSLQINQLGSASIHKMWSVGGLIMMDLSKFILHDQQADKMKCISEVVNIGIYIAMRRKLDLLKIIDQEPKEIRVDDCDR